MFREMLKSLAAGELPAAGPLRQRLAVALVKKAGILQQPRFCWSNDPKINPEAHHLLWAAVILEDGETIGLAVGLITMELQTRRPGASPVEIGAAIGQQLVALVELAPSPALHRELQARVDRAGSFLPRP